MGEQSLEQARRAGAAVIRTIPAVIRSEIAHSKMPFNYEAAKAHLVLCVKVDDILEIRNRAEAIAAYAKQIQDVSMGDNAKRIILRATRRIGELLLELESESCKRNKGRFASTKSASESYRNASIAARGFDSEHFIKNRKLEAQTNVGLLLAKIPVDKFEKHVADSPVKTPRQVLVAEGVYQKKDHVKTNRELFVDALITLKKVMDSEDPFDFGRELRSNSKSEFIAYVKQLHSWIDPVMKGIQDANRPRRHNL